MDAVVPSGKLQDFYKFTSHFIPDKSNFTFNPLKPTSYMMHQQFNIQQL